MDVVVTQLDDAVDNVRVSVRDKAISGWEMFWHSLRQLNVYRTYTEDGAGFDPRWQRAENSSTIFYYIVLVFACSILSVYYGATPALEYLTVTGETTQGSLLVPRNKYNEVTQMDKLVSTPICPCNEASTSLGNVLTGFQFRMDPVCHSNLFANATLALATAAVPMDMAAWLDSPVNVATHVFPYSAMLDLLSYSYIVQLLELCQEAQTLHSDSGAGLLSTTVVSANLLTQGSLGRVIKSKGVDSVFRNSLLLQSRSPYSSFQKFIPSIWSTTGSPTGGIHAYTVMGIPRLPMKARDSIGPWFDTSQCETVWMDGNRSWDETTNDSEAFLRALSSCAVTGSFLARCCWWTILNDPYSGQTCSEVTSVPCSKTTQSRVEAFREAMVLGTKWHKNATQPQASIQTYTGALLRRAMTMQKRSEQCDFAAPADCIVYPMESLQTIYDAYYNVCRPSQCTYMLERLPSGQRLLMVVLGCLGGVTILAKLLGGMMKQLWVAKGMKEHYQPPRQVSPKTVDSDVEQRGQPGISEALQRIAELEAQCEQLRARTVQFEGPRAAAAEQESTPVRAFPKEL